MSPKPTPEHGAAQVDAYLSSVPSPQRESLEQLRARLRSVLPRADECLTYGMPTFTLDGKGIAGYAAFKDHCSYFPMSSEVIRAAGDALDRYPTSKGGIRFDADGRLPVGLVRTLVKLRLAELAAVHNGTRREYDHQGRLKAVGPMKDGSLHGKWRWFRQDGTLLRTGQFAHGDQVGTWTTYDRDGNATKVTRF